MAKSKKTYIPIKKAKTKKTVWGRIRKFADSIPGAGRIGKKVGAGRLVSSRSRRIIGGDIGSYLKGRDLTEKQRKLLLAEIYSRGIGKDALDAMGLSKTPYAVKGGKVYKIKYSKKKGKK